MAIVITDKPSDIFLTQAEYERYLKDFQLAKMYKDTGILFEEYIRLRQKDTVDNVLHEYYSKATNTQKE